MENQIENRIKHKTFRSKCKSSKVTSPVRGIKGIIITAVLVMGLVTGCASTKITSQNQLGNEKLPRPGRIWVYDFVATDADVKANSYFYGHKSVHTTPQTHHHIYMGRKLGAMIAGELVSHIRDMGILAERGGTNTRMQINDIVLRGYLLSIVEGDAEKRVLIGFGAGESELKVAAEAFQVTTRGWRKIGSGTEDSAGSKGPGSVVGAAALVAKGNPAGLIIGTGIKVYGEKTGSSKVEGRAKQSAEEIAEILKERFQEQGWIK